MDLIAIMAALFLNASVGCSALPAEVHRVGGQDFLVKQWTCADNRGVVHVWRTWQRECVFEKAKDWGRPYFLEDETSHMAFYVNKFGEVQGGQGARIQDAYLPLCGS